MYRICFLKISTNTNLLFILFLWQKKYLSRDMLTSLFVLFNFFDTKVAINASLESDTHSCYYRENSMQLLNILRVWFALCTCLPYNSKLD